MTLLFGRALAAAALLVLPAGFAQAEAGLSCRTQIIYACTRTCTAKTGPADLSLDFDKKSGRFCRGEQCDDGKLSFQDEKGQWNQAPYRIFQLKKTGRGGYRVAGVISESKTFFAETKGLGRLAGTCEAGG